MFEVKMIADSVSDGVRLCTMQLTYPRFIHAEFMTHRVFSRNASSSRAIPVKRMLEDVLNRPAMPVHWGRNQPGMQAHESHDAPVILGLNGGEAMELSVQEAWKMAGISCARIAAAMDAAGYHKQVVNRVLEPWQHMNVIVSSTEWENFFALRDHEMAQPEIRVLAQMMKHEQEQSKPVELVESQWHLPYVLPQEVNTLSLSDLVKISAARCARVSYKTFEGTNPKFAEDIKLYDRLAGAEPAHLSPLEHVATPMAGQHGNFRGWRQLRQYHEAGETV